MSASDAAHPDASVGVSRTKETDLALDATAAYHAGPIDEAGQDDAAGPRNQHPPKF